MIPDNKHHDLNRLMVRWRDFEVSASGALGIGGVVFLAVLAIGCRVFGV